jgi:RHS repeat-associated protein
MTTTAREYGQDAAHELLNGQITVADAGYVYIYISNEEDTNPYEVYFDDFKVEHIKSPVVQMDDYYPFGLTFNSYSRENSTPNKFKFQGQEHIDDLNLGWDSFKWRNHQPDIGRFFNVDPLVEKYFYNSPYAFSENKVTSHVELEGLEAENFMSKFKDPGELKEKRPSENAQQQRYGVTVTDSKKSSAT